MAGEIGHVELVSGDFGKTREFYGEIFGWTFEDGSQPGMPYLLWKASSGVAGGVREPMSPEERPMVVNYIMVDDIDATLLKIEAHDGKVLMGKKEISPEIGWSALFVDPHGNTFGLFQEAKT